MEARNYLEHRFVSDDTVGNGMFFKLECKKSGKWEVVDDAISQHYALNGRLFYKKQNVWWMCDVYTMKPECLGERYFEGSFFLNEFCVSFFTQDASFKSIEYDNKVIIDYTNNLLFCKKGNKYDVYRIEYYPGFVASCCLMLRFGSVTEILHVKTDSGKMLHLCSRLNPDKTSYWQEVDIRPWYTKMYQRIKKALA